MRDAFFACTLSAALLASGCAEHATAARAPSTTAPPSAPAHLVLAEATSSSAQKEPPTTIEQHSEGNGRAFGWFSVGIGALGAGVALTTSALMLHQKSNRDSGCNAAKACSQDGLNANEQIAALSGWNIGSYVVAAAGLGLGAFLLITNPADGEKQTAIGVAPTGSGAGLNLRSTF